MKKDNIIRDKTYSFALRIIKLYKYLSEKQKEYVLSKQVLRSGTAIGALIRESEQAQSKPDFISKINIALKEANETDYWLQLLNDSKYITTKEYKSIQPEIHEIICLLVSILKTSKRNLKK